MKKTYLLILLLSALGLSSTHAQTWQSKVNSELLQKAQRGEKIDFMVVMNTDADVSGADALATKEEKGEYVYQRLKTHAQFSQSRVIKLLLEYKATYKSFWIVNALYVVGDVQLIQTIAQLEEVGQIQNNPKSKLNIQDIVPANTGQKTIPDVTWGIKNARVDSVWRVYNIKGQNVVIGGADTGYEWDHINLKKQYRGWNGTTANHNYNWHDAILPPTDTSRRNPCGFKTSQPCDDFGHGSHTMGTMAGQDTTAAFLSGLAPLSKWIGARNMDNGDGTLARYIDCFQWFIAPTNLADSFPQTAKAPHVINNSWYCSTAEGCNSSNFYLMDRAMNNTRSAGIVVVISVGNEGSQGCSSAKGPPGFFAKSFSVGAISANDTIANYSSRGPVIIDSSGRIKPDIVGPGTNVFSCVRGGGYANYSGTSMSGPHVTGVVALMISANSRLSGQVDTIEKIIKETARKRKAETICSQTADAIPNNSYGFGIIDAFSAVKRAIAWRPSNSTQEIVQTAKVYPNPANQVLFIDLVNGGGSCYFALYNVQGQEVAKQEWLNISNRLASPLQISMSNLPNGMYVYSIKTENGITTGKLVVNH
jgi:serine protease AprX